MSLAKRTEPTSEHPFALERDVKVELGYVVLSVAACIALIVAGQLQWAVITFMTTFFMFGIWRIAKGQFH